jgi:tRNA-specific 2-thiouridylase
MSKHGKILVAMSGGIDSTVAAVMLHNEGYEVVGITMKTWDYATSGGSKKETGCCNLDSINDARQVAVELGFPHFIVDIREEFGDAVIENFVEEYIAGRTPNPCVLCNTHIKWNALLKRAGQMDCEFIATGHYAQLREENGRMVVSTGCDDNKDFHKRLCAAANILWAHFIRKTFAKWHGIGATRNWQKNRRVMRFVLYPIMITAVF